MRSWVAVAGILFIGSFAQAAAQDLERQAAALKVIRETAAEICYTVALKGQRTETQLKGELEAKVNGAVAKVVGLGVSGSGELKTEDYQGVTRDALAGAIKSSAECRLNVLNSLISKMLPVAAPVPPHGDAGAPPVQTLPATVLPVPILPATTPPARPSYHAGQTIRDCPECPELVVVPQGEFLMGGSGPRAFDSNTDPQHPVRIAAFAAGRFEVTRQQFAAFARATNYRVDDSCTPSVGQRGEAGRSWQHPGFDQTDDHPAVCVSWDNAQAYIAWLKFRTRQNYRLLSEAEWEYSAKGGTQPQYFGVDYRTICAHGNVADQTGSIFAAGNVVPRQFAECRDGYVQTAPVGRFAPNRFGLYDTQGNVWEWVGDCYRGSYAGAPADQTAVEDPNCRYRVVRGGSWASVPSDATLERRTAKTPGSRFDDVGFRIARSL